MTGEDVGKQIKLKVTFTDDGGNRETLTSDATATVTTGNSRPTAFTNPLTPRLADGTPVRGLLRPSQTVKVGWDLWFNRHAIEDVDGLSNLSADPDGSGQLRVQWEHYNRGTHTSTLIEGATDSTYRLTNRDVGKWIQATIRYRDDAGYTNKYTSGFHPVAEEEPRTAAFANKPSTHDRTNAFTVDLRFSEAVELDAAGVRAALSVSGATLTSVAPVTDGNTQVWRLTVTPAGAAAVQVGLTATTDCDATGAVCTSDGRGLANAAAISIAAAAPVLPPLTAWFRNLPAEHDGSAFTFELYFSEAPKGLSYKTVRSNTERKAFFTVTGGSVKKAKRTVKKRNLVWRVTVEPDGPGEMNIGFGATLDTRDCAEATAICTEDGRKLSHSVSKLVPGPASLSVADAEVQEGPGASLDFVVTMTRARHEQTRVDYATSNNGSAIAGDDYTAASGTLVFATG